MKKFINKVTVTGADDSTDIEELFKIQKEYPFVEFGILLSKRYSLKDGTSRFPSKKWLTELIDKTEIAWNKNGNKPTIKLSGHICGEWTTEILKGNYPLFEQIHPHFDWYFDRWQINTHAEYRMVAFEELCDIVMDWLNCAPAQKVIFQLDGVNDILNKFIDRGLTLNVSGLFDLSHGAGLLPSSWPTASKDIYLGYAGGLSPDNVVKQIEKISKVCGDSIIWIDAETHLRSLDNRVFDLDRGVKFLDNTAPYVVE